MCERLGLLSTDMVFADEINLDALCAENRYGSHGGMEHV